jgi:LacI family repressor for deo operon, udp, cdd, tsx, nupC, and nupG
MPITQADIAKHLGISQVLVSYALRGTTGVSAETRERILATVKELGYDARANSGARSLAARRHGTRVLNGMIAVIFPFDSSPALRREPYYARLLGGIQTEAAAKGIEICMCPIQTSEIPRIVREKSVDGIIMLDNVTSDISAALSRAAHALDMPMVNLQWYSEEANCVCPDDRDGARQATRHLLELGHRRIAFLGTKCAPGLPADQRLWGYQDAMREYGIEVRDEWIEDDFILASCIADADEPGCGECSSCQGWTRLIAKNQTGLEPLTAIVCYNDIMAMSVIRQARRDGIDVPGDLSVVGFDDISTLYYFEPALTSVRLPLQEMGADAVRMVQEAIESNGESEPGYKQHVMPVSLMIRNSTARPPSF